MRHLIYLLLLAGFGSASADPHAPTAGLMGIWGACNPLSSTWTPQWANLVALWHLNETAGTTSLTDSSGSGNTGTATNVTMGASGKFSTASQFSGNAISFISTANQYASPAVFSISAWFKTTMTTNGVIVGFTTSQSGTPTNYDRAIYIGSGGKLTFTINNGTTNIFVASPLTYNDGNWHNVVGTFTANSMILYVDGSSVASTTTSVSTISSYNGYWRIAESILSSSIYYFVGGIDDVGIWNAVLSPTDVAAIHSSGVALASGWAPQWGSIQSVWHLDETSGTFADSSGNGNTGSSVGTPSSITSVSGQYSNAANFALPSVIYTATSIVNPTTFSLSLWTKTTSTMGGLLIGFGTVSVHNVANYDRIIYMNNNGTIAFAIYNAGVHQVTSARSYNDGKWHYVAGTYTANSLILYVDGVQVAATTSGVSAASVLTGTWRIGDIAISTVYSSNIASGGSFGGTIDEAAVWSVVLTPAQIQNIYTQQTCGLN